ncbi:MAG TPA: hypothetical protein DCS63_11165 [Elusimicrobia bacterium]|nr:hypothetical protein [Elusimicrobiota bacterium]
MMKKIIPLVYASLSLGCFAVSARAAAPNSFSITPAAQGDFGGWPQNGAHPYTLLTGNCYNLTVEALKADGTRETSYTGPVLLEQFALNSAGSAATPVVGISQAGNIGTSNMLGLSSVTVTLTDGVYTFGAGDQLGTQICFYAASRAPNDYESIATVGDFKLKASTPTATIPGVSSGYIVWHNSAQQMLMIPPIQGHVPASVSGSTGTVSPQVLGSPFRLTAKLTDAYWNRILKDSRTSDTLRFTASNSYVGLNPVQVAMTDGMVDTVATVTDKSVCNSTITLTVEDITANTNNGFIRSDTVDVYIATCTDSGGVVIPPQNEGYFQIANYPTSIIAGSNFTMDVVAKNVTIGDTSGDVQYKGQLVPLTAIAPGIYDFAPGTLGVSVFDFNATDHAVDPSDFTQTIANQTYNKTGIIWLELLAAKPDALSGASALAGPIQVFPGAASAISASASPAVIGPLSASVITVAEVDAFGNGIPGKTLYLQMVEGTQSRLSLNGVQDTFFRVLTDASGRAVLNLNSGQISEKVRLRVYAPAADALSEVYLDLTVSLLGNASLAAYPSPVRITRQPLNMEYRLDENSEVRLTITDAFGHEVYSKTYPAGAAGGLAGFNVVQWDGKAGSGEKAAAGVYGLHLEILARGQTRKLKTRFGISK